MSIGKFSFSLKAYMSAKCCWHIPSFATFRGYVIPRVYHVTAVTVYKLDGIEARTREYYNDSRLR
jgi:hypothetical protein